MFGRARDKRLPHGSKQNNHISVQSQFLKKSCGKTGFLHLLQPSSPSAHQAKSRAPWVVDVNSEYPRNGNSKEQDAIKDSIWNLSTLLHPGATSEQGFPWALLLLPGTYCAQKPALVAARTLGACLRQPVPLSSLVLPAQLCEAFHPRELEPVQWLRKTCLSIASVENGDSRSAFPCP